MDILVVITNVRTRIHVLHDIGKRKKKISVMYTFARLGYKISLR